MGYILEKPSFEGFFISEPLYMQPSSTKSIKTALQEQDKKALIDIIMELIRAKKVNKEQVSYLLFQASDHVEYVSGIKKMIEEAFDSMNTSSLYFVKKSLRSIIRSATKFIKYANDPVVEAEVFIFLAQQIIRLDIPVKKHQVMLNMYNALMQKIRKAHQSMHPDLQYEFDKILPQIDIYC